MNSHPKLTALKPKAATLLALATTLLPAMAQIPSAFEGFSRQNKTEIYGIGQYLHSDDINFNGPNGDIKTKMDDTGLGGFGIAFHFNDYLSIHGDFMFGGATFSANVPISLVPSPGQGTTTFLKEDAFIQTGRLNLDYNMINRRITPVLTAGIGYQYTEVELSHLPPVGYWYWDPWFGWVYYQGPPHAWQTDFTWNAGVGFRWNILDNLFVKAMANATWLEYSGSHGITTQIEGIFSIGWSF
jgi:opacity protein-like surface antigen